MIIASGSDFADALSASYLAKVKNAPILLVAGKSASVLSSTVDYVKKNAVANANVYIVGGTSVVPDSLIIDLKKAGCTVKRISGKNRYETCVEINHWFRNQFAKGTACLATGTNFPDALAGGVFAANKYAPLILTSPTVTEPQHKYFTTYQAKSVYVFGGAGAVSEKQIRDITCLRNGENFSA